ncbi:MAG TPA: hypothetical protein VHL79_24450 [Ramlibacter sp.]|nr:hypothetical protein [Ramlibacter sp.]
MSVDEHMQELYGWLAAMPATLRGRELLAQARLARSLATVRAAGMLQPLSTASGGSEPSPTDAPQVGGAALSEDAARQTRARLQVGFLAAVPPLS